MDEPEARESSTTAPGPRPREHSPASPAAAPDKDRAFAEFYRQFVPTLVGFLRWQGVPLREAADLAQETMVQAYKRWETIEHPQAWARRVASRMWARRISTVVEDRVADVPEPNPLLAVTDVTVWEQRHDVLRILDELPPRQRQVLAWTLDGYTPAEIADELKIAPEAVRSSLLKARRALAENPSITGEQR
ncbi:MAG TPA: sigma-70 family RNA polymerase sigma factor [Micromonosporaceae bacterium]|nr:sigma-70 family RNA polymerase sigma factor [Micromonosporaceae bacterium]